MAHTVHLAFTIAAATAVQQVGAQANPTQCAGNTDPRVVTDPDNAQAKCCTCSPINDNPQVCDNNAYSPISVFGIDKCCNKVVNAASYNAQCSASCGGNFPRLAADGQSCVASDGCGSDKPNTAGDRCCAPAGTDPVDAQYDATCVAKCGGDKPLLLVEGDLRRCVAESSCVAGKKPNRDKTRCCAVSPSITNAEYDTTCSAVCPTALPVLLAGSTSCVACPTGEQANKPANGAIPNRCCTSSVTNVASYDDNCKPTCPTAAYTLLSTDGRACVQSCEPGDLLKNSNTRCCTDVEGGTVGDNCVVSCPESIPLVAADGKSCVASCSTTDQTTVGNARCCTNMANAATYNTDCAITACNSGFSPNRVGTMCCSVITGAASYDDKCVPACPNGAGTNKFLQLDGKSCGANCDAGGRANADSTRCCAEVINAVSYDASCVAVCPNITGINILSGDGKWCKSACDTTIEIQIGARCCLSKKGVAGYNTDCTAKTCETGLTLSSGTCISLASPPATATPVLTPGFASSAVQYTTYAAIFGTILSFFAY